MKKGCIILLTFMLIQLNGFAQTYFGNVTDKKTKAPLAYVTVTLIKENIATSTDEKGAFRLASRKAQANDSLLFTFVGYIPVKIAAEALAKKRTIIMEEDEVILNQVNITSKEVKKKELKLNSFSVYDPGFTAMPDFYLNYVQVARKFISPNDISILKSVRVARLIRFPNDMASYNYKNGRTRFRIRIYDVDTLTGGPGKDICRDTIELQNNRNTFIEVDLSESKILITHKAFFIAVEWLLIPYNETITTAYEAYNDEVKNHKRGFARYTLEYDPVIYGVQPRGKNKIPGTWFMAVPNGKWMSAASHQYNADAAISAVIAVEK
ncbi:hypothetical protein GCM10023149_11860 [Mucilaginibacter gynuensis]|uniref:Carboxypeptidase-like protein n=1 Tax=Mucilaginibacter gynuensis TaxID=1302236 RepID=A0ABP8G1B6_9SPHI